METIQDLELLLDKYKRNSKLNANDSENAMKWIECLLKNEPHYLEKAIEYVFEFSNDIGISAFFNYYKMADEEEKMKTIEKFTTCKEFETNLSNKSVNRATALIGLMLKENPEDSNINYLLKAATRLILGKNKKDISKQCAEYFRKNIIDTAGDEFFNLKINEAIFTEEDFNLLKKWVIVSAFTAEELYKPQVLLKLLQWLTDQNYEVNFSNEDIDAILPYYEKWDAEIKAVLDNSPLADMFKKEPRKQSVVHPAKAALMSLEAEIVRLIEENNTLKLDLNNKNDIINRLEIKVNELLNNIDELERNLNKKIIEISDKDKEIESIKKNKEDLENRLKAAINLNAREENESLNNLKSKLSSQLKQDYSDFCKIMEKPMTKELGDILLVVTENIFNVLINNGITLE
ncbi:MAG TPA: hypothetical protein GXX43_02190 [Tepidanaerobacter syntrophicus]|uniref:hypothetical protein n=1 Tax=Tepidanaerobacter syntrophicus TaxID=224999 RepID=UPI00177A220A|nr:hypothetical protein [Tepidanaerobacter syntrophicus]HHV82461.1 hypothetical protein [Tepidanaerobacter syntrophicus]